MHATLPNPERAASTGGADLAGIPAGPAGPAGPGDPSEPVTVPGRRAEPDDATRPPATATPTAGSTPPPPTPPAAPTPPADADALGLGYVLAAARARAGFVVGFAAAALAIAGAYAATRPNLYQASALLLIESRAANAANATAVEDPLLDPARRLRTQHALIRAEPVLAPVLAQLPPGGRSGTLPRTVPGLAAALRVKADGEILRVSFAGSDPVEAAEVVNAVVTSFAQFSRERAAGVTSAGLAKLKAEAALLEGRVDETARAALAFRRAQGLVVTASGEATLVAESRVRDLQARREQVAVERAALAAAAATLAADARALPPGSGEAGRVDSLRGRLDRLEDEEMGLAAFAGPEHDLTRALAERRRALAERIDDLVATERAEWEVETAARLAALDAEAASLDRALDEADRAVAGSDAILSAYRMRVESHRAAERLHRRVADRIAEIELAVATAHADETALVLEPATPGEPVGRVAWGIATSAVALAVVAGLGLAVVAQVLADRRRVLAGQA